MITAGLDQIESGIFFVTNSSQTVFSICNASKFKSPEALSEK